MRIIASDLPNPIGRLISKLECAERAANNLVGVKHLMRALEISRPTGPQMDQTGQLYGSVLSPSIDHAVVVYCAQFNSSDRKNAGIGRYSPRDVFGDDKNSLEWHKFLKEYRNYEVAHLTSKNHKTFYLWTPVLSELMLTGFGTNKLSNSVQPGSQFWDAFCQHIEKTQLWFDTEAETLRDQIKRLIKAQPKGWLESLPSPNQNEQIKASWEQLIEILRNVSTSS